MRRIVTPGCTHPTQIGESVVESLCRIVRSTDYEQAIRLQDARNFLHSASRMSKVLNDLDHEDDRYAPLTEWKALCIAANENKSVALDAPGALVTNLDPHQSPRVSFVAGGEERGERT
ncbi:MAG: hypothetical protein QN152_05610 [Armatimonadota bacterium]|nr:hypothetical protein [Armatimonadota bacterium]MDR7463439.1 hypothetical protein [Armatimonadota bacterium]MDR7473952.1 hypothetical protein [Armatimonadota bacterium]MDR7538997.1 hypothetical protein [Armatimonadota bacterium]